MRISWSGGKRKETTWKTLAKKDNVKTDVKQIGCGVLDGIGPA
jgi:hypothetical protein